MDKSAGASVEHERMKSQASTFVHATPLRRITLVIGGLEKKGGLSDTVYDHLYQTDAVLEKKRIEGTDLYLIHNSWFFLLGKPIA